MKQKVALVGDIILKRQAEVGHLALGEQVPWMDQSFLHRNIACL